MQDLFSIYYNFYGKDEIKASKKKKSADELVILLKNFGFTTDDDLKWLDNVNIRIHLMKHLSDNVFHDTYTHKSKNSSSYYGKTMNITFKKILIEKIDIKTLRNIYCIIV